MTPQLESRFRRYKWPLLLMVGVVIAGVFWLNVNYPDHFSTPRVVEPEVTVAPPDEWLYVIGNSVLFFPVVNAECSPKNALGQVHKGTKVLVIARHGEWVEVVKDDQTALHTHGCVHTSMLEKRND